MTPSADSPVCESLQAAVRGLIDYAGMYPPASLPLAAAWTNYLAYRRSPDAWMLSHFVVGISALDQWLRLAQELPVTDNPPTLAIVGRPAATFAQWSEQWDSDLRAIGRIMEQAQQRLRVAALELKVPDDALDRDSRAGSFFDTIEKTSLLGAADKRAFSGHERESISFQSKQYAGAAVGSWMDFGMASTAMFLEIPLGDAWNSTLDLHVKGIAAAANEKSMPLGLKLRTGGLGATAFPSVEQVAAVINVCRRRKLPWKATAGLHHPIRQFRSEVNGPMHGFINVVVATVLAAAHELSAEQLVPILADETAEHFHFDAAGLSWNGLTASVEQIEAARREGMISLGSCSFDEPREDLRAIGWLQ